MFRENDRDMQTEITDKLIAVIVPFLEGLGLTNERLVWEWLKSNPKENGGFNDEFLIIGSVTSNKEFDFDCEKYIKPFYKKDFIWHNYNAKSLDDAWDCSTKEQSFISLLNSKGIFLEELKNQKILILEKL